MKEIPNIALETHNGRNYIDSEDYYSETILDCIKERKRFAEVQAIIEKINNSNSPDFTEYFNNHFLINSANINDAYISALALREVLINKHSETMEWEEKFKESEYQFLTENNPRPSARVFGGFSDDSFLDFGGNNNDDFSKELDATKVHIIQINSTYEFAAIADEIEKLDGFVFALCSMMPLMDDFPTPFSPTGNNNANEILASKSLELGYVYIKIGTDSPDSLQQMMLEKFDTMRFDVSKCQNELVEYCAALHNADEYHLNILIQSVLNQWLFSGKEEKVIEKDDIKKLIDCKTQSSIKPIAIQTNTSQSVVGLKNEQEKINGIVKMLVLEKTKHEMGIVGAFNGCNCCFAGSPGTAKTTLARIFTKQLAENNIIACEDNFKECRKSDITGMYVGWTAAKIDKMFSDMSYAGGGVIFFDEIYTLSEDNATCYDTEAVTCIVQNMENYRSNVFCIFAGYENKMDEFLSSNPGIRSRIQFNVKFKNYDNDTLFEVSKSICENSGFTLPRNARKVLDDYFDRLRVIRGDQFGNGREARNLISNASQKLAIRLWDVKNPDKKKLTSLTESDLSKAAADILASEIKIASKNSKKIGFR